MQIENAEPNLPNEEQVQPQTEEPKKRKKTNIYRFKQDILQDTEKGLVFLYKAQQNAISGVSNKQIDEIRELNSYIKLMEEWHYLVVPKYDFNYFTQQCQRFGQPLRVHLEQMRKAHKGIIPWDFISGPNEMAEEPTVFEGNAPIDLPRPQEQDPLTQPDQQLLEFIQNRQEQPAQAQAARPMVPTKKIIIKAPPPKQATPQPQKETRINDPLTDDFLENIFDKVQQCFDMKQQQRQSKTD